MSARDDDIAWYRELLAAAGRIDARRMFGGVGFYADGVMIALEAFGSLYLKTDDASRARFEAAGGQPFVYEGKGKPITMRYWTPPEDALDSADAMRPWALLALQAASAARRTTIGASPRKKTATKAVAKKAVPKRAAPKRAAQKHAAAKRTMVGNLSKENAGPKKARAGDASATKTSAKKASVKKAPVKKMLAKKIASRPKQR